MPLARRQDIPRRNSGVPSDTEASKTRPRGSKCTADFCSDLPLRSAALPPVRFSSRIQWRLARDGVLPRNLVCKPTTAASSRKSVPRPAPTANTCASRPPLTPIRATSEPRIASKKTSSWPGILRQPRRVPAQNLHLSALLEPGAPGLSQNRISTRGKSSSGSILAHLWTFACPTHLPRLFPGRPRGYAIPGPPERAKNWHRAA